MAEQRKPSVEQLGIDPGTLEWQRSGGTGAPVEVAFAVGWVLMRAPGQAAPVLVFSPFEWECFVEGVKKGEFDDAAS